MDFDTPNIGEQIDSLKKSPLLTVEDFQEKFSDIDEIDDFLDDTFAELPIDTQQEFLKIINTNDANVILYLKVGLPVSEKQVDDFIIKFENIEDETINQKKGEKQLQVSQLSQTLKKAQEKELLFPETEQKWAELNNQFEKIGNQIIAAN